MAERYIENAYKIKISRNRTEVTTYENMMLHTSEPIKETSKKKIKPSIPSDYKEFNYYNRMKKRRNVIKELIWNNFGVNLSSVITLTFRENDVKYTDYESAYVEFKKFIQRMNSHYDHFLYLSTYSRQKNGNWHFHVFTNLSQSVTNETVSSIWKNGYTYKTNLQTMERFKKSIDYLISNMNESAEAIHGKNGYLFSKNLERDKVVTSWRSEDTKEFNDYFPEVMNTSRKILYESKNHIGIKGKQVNNETGEIFSIQIPDRELTTTLEEAGYESWDTVYTHLTSAADFSEQFNPITAAVLKETRKYKSDIIK